MRPRLRPILALTLVGLFAFGGVAHATAYCVSPEASCAPANTFSTIQPALTAAQAPGFDVVRIGAGEFAVPTGGFTYTGDNVDIVGAGPNATVLREPSPSGGATQVDLDVNPSGPERSTVRGLGFVLSDPSFGPLGNAALSAHPGIDVFDIKVRAPGVTRPVGVVLGATATLSGGDIDFDFGAGASEAVVDIDSAAPAIVGHSVLRAATPVYVSSGAELTVRTTRVTALATGLYADGATINAHNVLVRLDPPAGDAVGFLALGDGGNAASVDARHATVTGGNSASTGLKVLSGTAAGETASGSLVSSIVRVPGTSLSRHAGGGGPVPAHLAANYNDFDPGATVDIGNFNGPGTSSDLNRVTADPRFLNEGAGDLRLRFDSAMVDAGHPVDLGTGPEDFAGGNRVVDGNGDGDARRDLGAYEYQHKPPAVSVSATPGTALTNDPFNWTATSVDPDGDPVNVTWTWSDGVGSSGPAVSRAFTSPGTYTGTAQATDPTGLSASAASAVTVGARPGPPGEGPPLRDTTPPSFSINAGKLKLTAKGTITLRMQCAPGEPEACTGKLSLVSAKKFGRRKKRALKLGSAAFGINAGGARSIRLKVPKSALATIRRLRSLKIVASAVGTDSAGNRGTARRTLTLTAARARR